jgi:riboflavin synthase
VFTGIISDIGAVRSIQPIGGGGVRVRIATSYKPETIATGASIACSGPCLTVVERGPAEENAFFDVEISAETLARTNLGRWTTGSRVNLERSLTLGEEFGGHLVTGHVDGVAEVAERWDEASMARFVFSAPPRLSRFIAEKGSVCLDGTSLTVNGVADERFEVTVIPHTLIVTTWNERRKGDLVNLEVDLVARYLDRLRTAS